jgi:hypothetical protein
MAGGFETPHPLFSLASSAGMGVQTSRSKEVLLAIALGSRQKQERRLLPDRRSGIERRRMSTDVEAERRSDVERRLAVRRRADQREGATLLQKARFRVTGRSREQLGRG